VEQKALGSKAVAGIIFFIKENLENLETLKPIALPERPQMELSLDSVNVPSADEVKPSPLAELAREFGLSGPQETALQGYVAREGLQYLLEKAEIVRSSPRANAGQTFMAALKGDWKKPITIDKKKSAKKALTENPHPEDVPKIDWEGIARTWMMASDQQRSDWLAAMPAEAQLFAPKPGQKPRTAFLGKLREIINSEVRAAA
jgi:hypothetical protein